MLAGTGGGGKATAVALVKAGHTWGVAGGRPTTDPFTAHALYGSHFVSKAIPLDFAFLMTGLGGGCIVPGTGGASLLAFFTPLHVGSVVSRFVATGTGGAAGLGFLEGHGAGDALGVAVLGTDSALKGEGVLGQPMHIFMSHKNNNHAQNIYVLTRGSANFIIESAWGEQSRFEGHMTGVT